MLHTILHQLFARLLITQIRTFTCNHDSGRHHAALSRQQFCAPWHPTSLLHTVPPRTRIVSARPLRVRNTTRKPTRSQLQFLRRSSDSCQNIISTAQAQTSISCDFLDRIVPTSQNCVRKSPTTHHNGQHTEDLPQRDNCCFAT